VAGSAQAAAARQKDIATIQQEVQNLGQLANAAKQTNVQLLYGGRNDMTQHLSDMAQELNYTTLLNRQKWLGFSSVQQAMSYRQQMYNLALLENKAHFAGYLTADQYLGFLQRETMQTATLSAAIRDRTSAIASETSALLAHTNALQGTHQTVGSLGEQLTTAGVYAAALSGVPSVVSTRALFDDSQALGQLAAWRAALAGLPRAESTDITAAATRLGGIPLTGERVPVQVTPVIEASGAPAGLAAAAQLMAQFQRNAIGTSLALRDFGESALLAAVDARALEEGISRITAASRMMAEELAGSEYWTDLYELSQAVTRRTVSNQPAPVLQGQVIESRYELEGIPEDIAEVSALDEALRAIPAETHRSSTSMTWRRMMSWRGSPRRGSRSRKARSSRLSSTTPGPRTAWSPSSASSWRQRGTSTPSPPSSTTRRR
jgi:hypothetical protein